MDTFIKNNIIKKSPKHWAFFCCIIILFLSFILQNIFPKYESTFVLRQDDYFFQIQIFTYSLFHLNSLHFISNILIFITLYAFVQTYFENKYIWITFVLGILLGALAFLWIPNANDNSYLMGLSSGNLGWLMVLLVNNSKSEVKIGKTTFRLKHIMIFLIIFHISSLILDQSSSWQAHFGALLLFPILFFYNKTNLIK